MTEEFIPELEHEPSVTSVFHMEEGPFDFKGHDPNADTIASIPSLLRKSRVEMPYRAESHRGFWVSASAVAYDPSPENPRRAIFTAGNFKAKLKEEERDAIDVDDISKVCAEMGVLIPAEDQGFKWIGSIVIVATVNSARIKEVTGVRSGTLHPCGDCGDALWHSDLTNNHTPIFTAGSAPEFKQYQLQSLEEYRKRYERHHRGKGFRDTKMRDYVAIEWEHKKELYLSEVERQKIRRNNKTDVEARRKLMMKVMVRELG